MSYRAALPHVKISIKIYQILVILIKVGIISLFQRKLFMSRFLDTIENIKIIFKFAELFLLLNLKTIF